MSGRLELQGLRKSFGGVVATDDVTLGFEPGTLSAIIGPNGAGKTTLFHLITGKLPVTGPLPALIQACRRPVRASVTSANRPR